MASFNKVIIAGNLTRDPELRYTPKGMAVAKIGLAVNRTYTASEGGEKRGKFGKANHRQSPRGWGNAKILRGVSWGVDPTNCKAM